MRALAILTILTSLGCLLPPPSVVTTVCFSDGDCPAGASCEDGACLRPPLVDAGPIFDVPPEPKIVDAGPIDAGDPRDAGGPLAEDAGLDAGAPIDAGPIDAGPDPCEPWAIPDAEARVRVQASSVAGSEIPAGYLLKLRLDTRALNSELRVVHCQTEVPFVFHEGSALGDADAVIMVRAAAPIPPGASDTDYFIYAGASDPADAADVPAFRVLHFFREQVTLSGSNITTTIPATTGAERWLVLISWQQADANGSLQSEASNGQLTVTLDNATVENLANLGHAQDPADRSGAAWLLLEPDNADRALRLELRNDGLGDADAFHHVHVVGALLPIDTDTAQDVVLDTDISGEDTPLSSLDVPAGGPYLWLANAVHRSNGNIEARFTNGLQRHFAHDTQPASGGRSLMWHAEIVDEATTAQVILVADASPTGTVDAARSLLVSLDGFDVFRSDNGAPVNYTLDAFVEHASLTIPGGEVERDLLLLSSAQMGHAEGSNDRSFGRLRLLDDDVEQEEVIDVIDSERVLTDRSFAWNAARTTANAVTLEQSVRNEPVNTTDFGRSHIMGLRYFDVVTRASAKQANPLLDAGP